MPPKIHKFQARLDKFLTQLDKHKTGVKFLFFHAKNLDKPMVRKCFNQWILDGREFYVGQGERNYVYIYEKKDLAYMVRFVPGPPGYNTSINTSMTELENTVMPVTILSQKSPEQCENKAYIGDHIDIGIVLSYENNNDLLIKTHMTVYIPTADERFNRTADQCNFLLSQTKLQDFQEFRDMQYCYNRQNEPRDKLTGVYADIGKERAIFNFCRMLDGRSYEKQKDDKNNSIQLGPRGGMYKQTGGGTKKYIGGRPTYQGLSFMNTNVINLIRDHFVKPVESILKYGFDSAQIIFDELNELNDNGNHNIVIMYDHGDGMNLVDRSIFFLDTNVILQAAYVESVPEAQRSEKVNAEELRCHQQVIEAANRIIEIIA